ncbi:MAG: hypothetical protein WDZ91_04205 [Paenibacillaceae bacterium]
MFQINIQPISLVIPEKNIVVLSPHYDDTIFFLGGYIFELKDKNLLDSKKFENISVFSRSNYQARDDEGNKDISLERIKVASGRRIFEDLNCLDELFGEYNFKFRLLGEKESQVRGKTFADSNMEFPHGMYENFEDCDWKIMGRLKKVIEELAEREDTAIVLPVGFKEHIDHFIVREAGIAVAKELGVKAKAKFYFAEDKPYSGIADEVELERIKQFVNANNLDCIAYRHHPDKVIEVSFKHYVSQVEGVYITGINHRSDYLKSLYAVNHPVDRIYTFNA